MEEVQKILFALLLVSFCSYCLYLYNLAWLRPEKMRKKLRSQGIAGPPPSFIYGNMKEMKRSSPLPPPEAGEDGVGHISHNFSQLLFPHFVKWRKEYGPLFVYSMGNIPILYVSQPETVKEMNLRKSLEFGRPTYHKKDAKAMFGEGVVSSNGLKWAHQRKIIAPELFMDKVKGYVDLMVDSTTQFLQGWEGRIQEAGGVADIKIDEDLRNLSADIISRACFGSSYLKGKDIFAKIRILQTTMPIHVGIPGLRYLPTKTNRKIWRLEREVRSLILQVVKQRRAEPRTRSERDLLQCILEEATASHMGGLTVNKFVVDNCKNIYFAGHETTATAAAWTLLLLALNPEWQARARQEVAEVCGTQPPNTEMFRKMKTLTAVIQESMRLYPPAPFVSRGLFQDMDFNGMHLPKGLAVWVSALELHHSPEIWGPDAHEFNPERFSNGVSNACNHPYLYMPFGFGSRTCLGLNFAMVELKVILSLLLSNLTFSVSPRYRHAPVFRMFLQPGNGVDLLVRKV